MHDYKADIFIDLVLEGYTAEEASKLVNKVAEGLQVPSKSVRPTGSTVQSTMKAKARQASA